MDYTLREIVRMHKYTILTIIAAIAVLIVQGMNQNDAIEFIKDQGLYQEYTKYKDL